MNIFIIGIGFIVIVLTTMKNSQFKDELIVLKKQLNLANQENSYNSLTNINISPEFKKRLHNLKVDGNEYQAVKEFSDKTDLDLILSKKFIKTYNRKQDLGLVFFFKNI